MIPLGEFPTAPLNAQGGHLFPASFTNSGRRMKSIQRVNVDFADDMGEALQDAAAYERDGAVNLRVTGFAPTA